MTEPFQIVFVQHDEIVKTLRAHHRKAGQQSELSIEGNKDCAEIPRSSKSAKRARVCLARAIPFQVHLFRHKRATRLAAGFWHTELLDGCQRIGHIVSHAAQPQLVDSTLIRPPVLDAINTDLEYIHCGILEQEVYSKRGLYTLRISPSFHSSMDDYVFSTSYCTPCSSEKCSTASAAYRTDCNYELTSCSESESTLSDTGSECTSSSVMSNDSGRRSLIDTWRRKNRRLEDASSPYPKDWKKYRSVPDAVKKSPARIQTTCIDELLKAKMTERLGKRVTITSENRQR